MNDESTRQVDAGASHRNEKLAESLSRVLEQEVIDQGWPVGSVLGSEAELLGRFGVSRAVLREAIRLLEHHEVARMRRGPGGGLVVTAPNGQAVVRSVLLLLEYDDVTNAQLLEARAGVELDAVELAARRATEPVLATLREAFEEERRAIERAVSSPQFDCFHIAVAGATGNPAVRLFVSVLAQLTTLRSSPNFRRVSVREQASAAREAHSAHEGIHEAIVAGDCALARERMRRHLEAMVPWVADDAGPDESDASTVATRSALPE